MDDKVKDLLDKIRGAADLAADAAADTARVAGRRAGQVMYDTLLGRAGDGDSVTALLEKADPAAARVAEVKGRIADLRQTQACPSCGAPCGKEDKFCRQCGAALE